MYERYFGLRERAFDLTPNPRRLLFTAAHREALSNLQYAVASSQALTLLIGEAGTGKTTVVRRAVQIGDSARRGTWIHLANPRLGRDEFLEFLAESFGVATEGGVSKTRILRELERVLRQRRIEGTPSALIVDEAQSLPDELLEELRLLANLESDTHKLLPIVLSGQPELADRLNEWRFRHLKQRVALRCALAPLTQEESAAYIAGRIRLAGGDPMRLFSREAVIAIYARSRGIPRTINVICENALLNAFAAQKPLVCADLVEEVARDFDLAEEPPAPAAPVAEAAATKVRPFRPASEQPTSNRWLSSLRLPSQPRGGGR